MYKNNIGKHSISAENIKIMTVAYTCYKIKLGKATFILMVQICSDFNISYIRIRFESDPIFRTKQFVCGNNLQPLIYFFLGLSIKINVFF